jgi:hypothetical protein
MSMKSIVAAGLAACALLTGLPSAHADKVSRPAANNQPASEAADVPGENIFGFTDPTDVGNPGDTAIGSENTGRTGKRLGRYFTLQSKTELSRTLGENTWGAVSLFNSYYRVRDVADLDRNLNRTAFDGLSFEIARRVVERSATNPFAVTLALEPRWSRLDAVAGTRVESFSAEAKLFVDAVVVPEKLFWAMNLNYAPGTQRGVEPWAKWVDSAGTNVSTALTYAWSPSVFMGGEVRLLSAFNTALLGRYAGSALFIGPTFLWKITDKVAFNAVWTPQVAGRSEGNKDRLYDLDNFERHQFRAKLAVQF